MAMGALDKVFCCHQVEVKHAHVVRTKLAKKASDHLPLVLEVHLRPTILDGT
jgi:endonuclease/exonuclease/phosphatase family metal-dependent hydrolase